AALPHAVRTALETRQFYRDRLRITTRELQTMEWSTVVTRLVGLQTRTRFQLTDAPLTALSISARVMRRDNYLVALINKGVLPLGSPDWTTTFVGSRLAPWWMGQTIEWNLRTALLNHMFDRRT